MSQLQHCQALFPKTGGIERDICKVNVIINHLSVKPDINKQPHLKSDKKRIGLDKHLIKENATRHHMHLPE